MFTGRSSVKYGYFAVNIRNARRVPANKRDAGHRPMAAATGAVEITMPVAIVAAAYIIGRGSSMRLAIR